MIEEGLLTQEEYEELVEELREASESTPSSTVNVTKIGPGATVTTGQGGSGRAYGEVQVGSGDYSGLEHYRID